MPPFSANCNPLTRTTNKRYTLKKITKMNKDRFLKVLCWELTQNKRGYITMALVFLAIILIPQLLALIIERSSANTIEFTSTLADLIFWAYMTVVGATIFTHIKTRQQRINDFMLPAANLEKFIARYLVIVVAMPLAAIAGLLVGDVLQYVLTLITGGAHAEWASGYFFTFTQSASFVVMKSSMPHPGLFLAAGMLSQHAVFLLFGSIYHKHPVVMSMVTWIACAIAMFIAFIVVGKGVSNFLDHGYIIEISNLWITVVYTLVNIVFTVFCFWFAYRRYTRLQVINNQWINK